MITRKEFLNNKPLVVAGPCSVSSRDQIIQIAKKVKRYGAHALRAQLWKPRTEPDSFQGVGARGIKWIKEIKEKIKIPIVMEMLDPTHVGKVEDVVDILWVGARNMQNFELLKRIGNDPRPVILKRGLVSTIREWMGAAKYVGLDKVIMCERGIRTGADSMRFTLDFNSALVVKHDYNLPVIIDPSHTAGRRDMVKYLTRAAIAVGADGIVVETHTNPEKELVDKNQTISTKSFKKLVSDINKVYKIIKSLN